MRYLIYELWNPNSDTPFYVGWTDTLKKGISRPNEHMIEARRSDGPATSGNRLKLNIIKKIHNSGQEVVIKHVSTYDDFKESLQCERDLIAVWGRRDLKLGPLANLTDGGEGTLGRKDSEYTRKLKSIGRIGKKHSDKSKALIREKRKKQKKTIWSDISRKRMSENTWFRTTKGKTLEELYGDKKAQIMKTQHSIRQTAYRANPDNELRRKKAHKLSWMRKMKTVYVQIFEMLDDGYKQYEIIKTLNIGADTVRKARKKRQEIEQLIDEINQENV